MIDDSYLYLDDFKISFCIRYLSEIETYINDTFLTFKRLVIFRKLNLSRFDTLQELCFYKLPLNDKKETFQSIYDEHAPKYIQKKDKEKKMESFLKAYIIRYYLSRYKKIHISTHCNESTRLKYRRFKTLYRIAPYIQSVQIETEYNYCFDIIYYIAFIFSIKHAFDVINSK